MGRDQGRGRALRASKERLKDVTFRLSLARRRSQTEVSVPELPRSEGEPLDANTRQYMEGAFGHDFGQVRVHADAQSTAAARALGAEAFTVGQDIYFAEDAYRPDMHDGRSLLAHELAHTIQQRSGEARRFQAVGRVSNADDPSEREAVTAEARIAAGQSIGPDTLSRSAAGEHVIARRLVAPPQRGQSEQIRTPEGLVETLTEGILRSLRTDPEDRLGRVRRQLARLAMHTRETVIERIRARLTTPEWQHLERVLAEPPPDTLDPTPLPAHAPPSPEATEEIERGTDSQRVAEVEAGVETGGDEGQEEVDTAPLPAAAEDVTTEAAGPDGALASTTANTLTGPVPVTTEEAPSVEAPTEEGKPDVEPAAEAAAAPEMAPQDAAHAETVPASPEADAAGATTAAAPESDVTPDLGGLDALEQEVAPSDEQDEVSADRPAVPETVEAAEAGDNTASQPEVTEDQSVADAGAESTAGGDGAAEAAPSVEPPTVEPDTVEPEETATPQLPESPQYAPPTDEADVAETPGREAEDDLVAQGVDDTSRTGLPEGGESYLAAPTPTAGPGADAGAAGEEEGTAIPGGAGGGGVAIEGEAVPPPPDVSSSDPEAALATAGSLPPAQLAATLGGVATAATRTVGVQRSELAASPPQMERPSGAPTTSASSAPGAETTTPAAEGRRVERVPQGRPAPIPRPEPLPPAAAPPTQSLPTPSIANSTQGELSPDDVQAMRSAVRNLPTADPALDVTAGPAPRLELTGNADPQQAREQRAVLERSTIEARTQGSRDAIQPLGEDSILPTVPQETLHAEIPGGESNAGASPASNTPSTAGAAGGPSDNGGPEEQAASIVAQEQRGPEIRAAVAQGRVDMAASRQQQNARAAEARANSQTEIDSLVTANAAEQAAERSTAQREVLGQRQQWNQEQQSLVDRAHTDAETATQTADRDVATQQRDAERQSAQHIEQGNRDAATARREGEEQAARERRNAERESSGGFFGWVADRARAFFDGIKRAIQRAFERARQLVRAAIQRAQQLATAVIERARQAIVAAIRLAGDALIAIGDRLLAGFPGLRDRFRRAIRERVARAEAAVNRLANQLKEEVQRALNMLGAALDAALGLLERGLLAAVDAVGTVVQGAIQAARAAIQALAAFAALIRDVAANPGQWIRNLGAAIVDGIRNHLWRALKRAIRQWFNEKVEQVLGLGRAIWELLTRGGISLARIGRMVWEALKRAIPIALIQILIQKLVSMLVPAAALVMAIIEGLQAAWGTVSRIIQALERFFAFLRAVKTGRAGPQFAEALASAAVAVIDFVSNWLLARLARGAGAVAGRIRAIAQRIGARLRRAMRGATRRLRSLGGRLRRGLASRLRRRRAGRRSTGRRETPAQRARALLLARRIAETADRRNLRIRVVLRRLARLKRRFRWIQRFEAQRMGDEGRYSVWMIASRTQVEADYTEQEPERVKIRLRRPRQFWKSTREILRIAFEEEHRRNIARPLVKRGMARRHIISSYEVLKHYETTLNGKTFRQAKSIIEAKGVVKVGTPLNNQAIQAAAQLLLRAFFNDTENLWVGDSAENSSIQEERDYPSDLSAAAKRSHVAAIKRRYFLRP